MSINAVCHNTTCYNNVLIAFLYIVGLLLLLLFALHFLSAVPHFVLASYYVKVIVNKGSVVKIVSI